VQPNRVVEVVEGPALFLLLFFGAGSAHERTIHSFKSQWCQPRTRRVRAAEEGASEIVSSCAGSLPLSAGVMCARTSHQRAYGALSSRTPAREREVDGEEGQSSRQPYRCGTHELPIRPKSWWWCPVQRANGTLFTRAWRYATHHGPVRSRSFESRTGKGQRRKGQHASTAHRSTASQLWWTLLLVLNLCMLGLPGAQAVDILFPDGVDMADVGVIKVPQGPLVLLSFSGRYVRAKCSCSPLYLLPT
jgi:hypothetical protein